MLVLWSTLYRARFWERFLNSFSKNDKLSKLTNQKTKKKGEKQGKLNNQKEVTKQGKIMTSFHKCDL